MLLYGKIVPKSVTRPQGSLKRNLMTQWAMGLSAIFGKRIRREFTLFNLPDSGINSNPTAPHQKLESSILRSVRQTILWRTDLQACWRAGLWQELRPFEAIQLYAPRCYNSSMLWALFNSVAACRVTSVSKVDRDVPVLDLCSKHGRP